MLHRRRPDYGRHRRRPDYGETYSYTNCRFQVGASYKAFVYVIGNYTSGFDGTLSPPLEISLPFSNKLSAFSLTATPTTGAVAFSATPESNGRLWGAVFPMAAFANNTVGDFLLKVADVQAGLVNAVVAQCKVANQVG